MSVQKALKKCWRIILLAFHSRCCCVYIQAPRRAPGSSSATAVPALRETRTIAGICNHRTSQTGLMGSSSDLSKPTRGITNATSGEMWASQGFLTTSVWNLPTLKSFWEWSKRSGNETDTEAGGCEVNPGRQGTEGAIHTGLFALSGKWSSAFFLKKIWSICSYLSKQGKNRGKGVDSWLKGKTPHLCIVQIAKRTCKAPEWEKDAISVKWLSLAARLGCGCAQQTTAAPPAAWRSPALRLWTQLLLLQEHLPTTSNYQVFYRI